MGADQSWCPLSPIGCGAEPRIADAGASGDASRMPALFTPHTRPAWPLSRPSPTLVIYLSIRIYLHTGTHLAKVGFQANTPPHQRRSARSHRPSPTLVIYLSIRIYLHTGTHLAKVGFCLLEGMQCREQVWGGGGAARGCGAGTAALRQQTTEDRQQAANGKQQTAGRRRRVGGSTAAPRHDSTTTPPRKTPLGPAPESVTGPAGRKRDYYLAVKRGKA